MLAGHFAGALAVLAVAAGCGQGEQPPSPRVGGGELALDTYLGRPLVIVAGDPEGIRRTVERLLPLTGGGTKPQLPGMLIAIPPEDWKGSLLDPDDAKSFTDSVAKSAGTFISVRSVRRAAAMFGRSTAGGDRSCHLLLWL